MKDLELESVRSGYGRMEILHEVSLRVEQGEIVSLIGANGAGKTTTLRAIAGIARVFGGTIRLDGDDVTNLRPDLVVRRGLVHVAQDRELFGDLTVHDNLVMGGYARPRTERDGSLEEVYALFPVLQDRATQRADTMSGGQQQMLAIGRALMARPSCLTLDEPSVGLSPKLAQEVLGAIGRIRDTGVTVLIVEQNASQALAISDRAYVIESGSIVLDGPASELADDDRVREAYLAV
jgi:branched-chain amino acid transport system ATP-binding protein